MKITKIEVQKRNKERVSIFVDDHYAFSLHAEIAYKYNLKAGMELDESFISEIGDVEEQKKANNYILTILSKSFKTEKQLKDKLKEKGFQDKHIDNAIELMKSYKYIDDERFAKSYVNDSISFTKMGKNKIKNKLYAKGIDKDTINETLNSLVDDEQQFEAAFSLASKKYPNIKEQDKRKKNQKLVSFLQYRGFSFDIIKKVIDKLNNDFFDEQY